MQRRRVKCAQRRPHACQLNHSYELSTLNKDALLFLLFSRSGFIIVVVILRDGDKHSGGALSLISLP